MTIQTSTQLDVFTVTKNLVLANTTLGKILRSSDFYEFEPNFKSSSFRFPAMIINIPNTNTKGISFQHKHTSKDFTVIIELLNEYVAKDNIRSYCTALINTIELNQQSYFDLGYQDVEIDLDNSDTEIKNQKNIIRSTFTLTLNGLLNR